jgi:uncharacterized protein YjbI with pentapeptide repeats
MADQAQLDRLKQGVVVWNTWRNANRTTKIDLSDADLAGAHLDAANLSGADLNSADLSNAQLIEADLTDANLHHANLSHASLVNAHLRGAVCSHANLTRAQLYGTSLVGQMLGCANLTGAGLNNANLEGANLNSANLTGACLSIANLRNADLNGAILSGTDLCNANVSGADVGNIHWDPSSMRGKFLGIRGVDSCFGNALFKRAAADQDYLDTLEANWRHTWRIWLFKAWGCLDFGRSISRVAALGICIVSLFAALYYCWPTLLSTAPHASTWFTPYHYSLVTFTNFGVSNARPAQVISELLASIEVTMGYITLGLLLAVLSQKLARLS